MIAIVRPAINEIFPVETGRTCLDLTEIRDGQQSKFGAVMIQKHRYELAPHIDAYYAAASGSDGMAKFRGAAEVGGGTRPRMGLEMGENPFDDIRELRKLMPHSPFMALIRSDAGGGMEELAPDILRAYIKEYHAAGIDVFRNFHALNDPRAHKRVYDAVREAGGHFQAAFSWAALEKDPTVYNAQTVVTFFKKLKELGIKPDSYVLKDPAGVLTPDMAKFITRAVKKAQESGELEQGIAFGIHTHNQAGWAHNAYMAAIKEGANFVDAGADAGGFGAQPPAVPLLMDIIIKRPKSLGLPEKDGNPDVMPAFHALQQIDKTTNALLEVKNADGTKLLYDPEIRQDKADPSVVVHCIAGGQSSGAKAEMKKAGLNIAENMPKLQALIPLVRVEAGGVCQVTPVADYLLREALRRLPFANEADKRGLKGEDRAKFIAEKAKGKFYCGFSRILTGEMGPTKEPVDDVMAKQALLERARDKLKRYHEEKDLIDRPTLDALTQHKVAESITDYMWDLAQSVRTIARLREMSERIGELQVIARDSEQVAFMNQQIAEAKMDGCSTLDEAIGKLQSDMNWLELRCQTQLLFQVHKLGVAGVDISVFAGNTDAEKYEAMYEAIQRPDFKNAALATPATSDDPLRKLFDDIRRKALGNVGSDILNDLDPAVLVKTIRNAGMTTACMGEIIPNGLEEAKVFLAELSKKGEYCYPVSPQAQLQDQIIIGMMHNPRADMKARHNLPREFFRKRDGLKQAKEGDVLKDTAMQRSGALESLSASLTSVSMNVTFPAGTDLAAIDGKLRTELVARELDKGMRDLRITQGTVDGTATVSYKKVKGTPNPDLAVMTLVKTSLGEERQGEISFSRPFTKDQAVEAARG